MPPGPHVLSDVLISSAVVAGEDGATPANVTRTGPGGSFEFVNADMDPDLAMVLAGPRQARTIRQTRRIRQARRKEGPGVGCGILTHGFRVRTAAQALRISMEEERARQERAAGAAGAPGASSVVRIRNEVSSVVFTRYAAPAQSRIPPSPARFRSVGSTN